MSEYVLVCQCRRVFKSMADAKAHFHSEAEVPDPAAEFEFRVATREEMHVMDVKFPDVEVQLSGQDGNAFMILGLVQKGMRRAGCTPEEVQAFHDEATSGDYDHLLQTAMRTVNVS